MTDARKPQEPVGKGDWAIFAGFLAVVALLIFGAVSLFTGSDEKPKVATVTTPAEPTSTTQAPTTTEPDLYAAEIARRDAARRRAKTSSTAKPSAPSQSDKQIVADRQFYLRMDDDAFLLDTAIGDALHDDGSARARISEIKARVVKRANRRLSAGASMSIGANLLISAAAEALVAIDTTHIRDLVRARVGVVDARSKLASEVASP